MYTGRTNKMRSLKRALSLLLLLIFTFSLATGVYAASNDVAQVTTTFKAKPSEKEINRNAYSVFVDLEKPTKLKKNITIDAKIIVPASIFTSEDDELRIIPGFELATADAKDYVCGFVSNYIFYLSKEGKSPILTKQLSNGDKFTAAGTYGSVKKSGNYYVVSLKKVPLYDISSSDDSIKLSSLVSKGETYMPGVSVLLRGNFKKKVSKKNIYIDDVKLNAASVQTVNFSNKKAYRALHVDIAGKAGKVKVVKLNY
jgi:hypothetical protein